MRLAIRDDDTCYFTRPEELEAVYGNFCGLRVSLAVTPFALQCEHIGDARRFRQFGEPRPIAQNRELIHYLRQELSAGRYSALLHGHTHEYQKSDDRWIAECDWKPADRIGRETAEGKRYVESVLGTPIDTFVPPGNALTRAAAGAVGLSLENILSTLPLRRAAEFLGSPAHWGVWLRRVRDQVTLGGPSTGCYPMGRVRFLACTSWTAASEWSRVLDRLELCRRRRADFVLAVHYWELKGQLRDGLRRLVDRALEMGFEPAHCSELFPSTVARTGAADAEDRGETKWADSRTY